MKSVPDSLGNFNHYIPIDFAFNQNNKYLNTSINLKESNLSKLIMQSLAGTNFEIYQKNNMKL